MTTTNVVPSSDVSDFLFNVQKLDEITTGSALTYVDRFGVERSTAAGAMARFAALNPRGAWAPATVYQPRDLVLNSGTWYVALDTHTSGATFAGDLSAHWRPEQGITAADMANIVSAVLGAALLGYKRTLAYTTGIGLALNQSITNICWIPGFVGDGVADDSAAFKLAASYGGTIWIPENKTVRIATAITSTDLTVPFDVLGASRISSIVYCDVNGVAIQTTNSNARQQWSNIYLKGNLSNANGAGLDLFDNSSRTLSRMNVSNFAKTAIQIKQSVAPILDDLRMFSVGSGIVLNPGSTATIAPKLKDIYISAATIVGIDITGACQSACIDTPTIETSAIGIRATSANGEIIKPYYELNTLDTVFADSEWIQRSDKSTGSHFTNSYSGSVATHKKFMWRHGAETMAVGGMTNTSTRTNSVANTWEAFNFNGQYLSPYVQPNPGGSSFNRITIVTAGLYYIEYNATWTTATAVAGWGNLRLLKNSTEVPGSFSQVYVPAVAGASVNAKRSLIVELAAGDNIDIQFGVSDTQVRIAGNFGGNGPAPTSATAASFTVRHLGATSALSL